MTTRILYLIAIILCYMLSNPSWATALDSDNYKEEGKAKGTILLAVNWGRKWKCGAYENAQLEKLDFHLIPDNNSQSDETSITLDSPSRLFVKPTFLNYGFLVKPGKYALTEFSVKVAKSTTDVGYFKAGKDKLVIDGDPKGGTFNVKAGEVIYIGHFFIDCYKEPIPWRFYPEGKEAFNGYVKSIKNELDFLNDANIKFRLFDTTNFGNPYELP
jgi:hypothetical protein